MTKNHRAPRFVSAILAASLLVLGAAGTASADDRKAIENPFPARFAQSDVRVDLEPLADGLVMPLWLTHAGDGSGRLFVIDQPGQVRLIKGGRMVDRVVLDLSERMVAIKPNFDERGLLGLAFHPGFADASSPGFGRVYTCSSETAVDGVKPDFTVEMGGTQAPDHECVVAEWRFSASDPDVIDPATRREVLRFQQPQFNHDGGGLAFGPDGMLYLGIGDGGNAHDKGPGHSPGGNGQDGTNLLGTIIRIDPLCSTGRKSTSGGYSVPQDNPFVGNDKVLDEIWAYGLRNPYRISFDRKTGILVTGDVGQGMIEEIDVIERGGNYGSRIKEGSFFFTAEKGREGQIFHEPLPGDLPKMIDPVAEYDHDEGISVIGGFVYRGRKLPGLDGLYVFGEWKMKVPKSRAGRLLHADLKTGEIREMLLPGDAPMKVYVSGMGEDESGEVYVLTSANVGPKGTTGQVFRIVPR